MAASLALLVGSVAPLLIRSLGFEMNMKLFFILSFLLILCLSSFISGIINDSNAAYALSGAALLPFVGIFAVGVLDYKVGGNQLTLERRVDHVEKENKELKDIVTSLSKAMFVVARGSSGFGGMRKDHYELIEMYLEPISHHLPSNIKDSVIKEVEQIFEEYNKKRT